ncbi:MAG: helix-turn-helix domain-containing protein [Betaproteobacteria bacterium]|nr:helix-turn-helix domain-containing protein [Betaproteobacteria bacterium]
MSIEKDVNREIIFSRIESLVKGRSISQFARDCGIKQPVMDSYIKRKRMPVAENLIKICIANAVTSDWVLGMTNENGITIKSNSTITAKVIKLKADAISVSEDVSRLVNSIDKIARAL